MSSKPCNVRKRGCDGEPEKERGTFLQREGRIIVFFIAIGAAAVFLTFITANLTLYFGNNIDVGAGIFWNTNIFVSYLISFLFIPIIYTYYASTREHIKKRFGNNESKKK